MNTILFELSLAGNRSIVAYDTTGGIGQTYGAKKKTVLGLIRGLRYIRSIRNGVVNSPRPASTLISGKERSGRRQPRVIQGRPERTRVPAAISCGSRERAVLGDIEARENVFITATGRVLGQVTPGRSSETRGCTIRPRLRSVHRRLTEGGSALRPAGARIAFPDNRPERRW